MLEQKQFSGKTRTEAQQAAELWWQAQTGLKRISEYTSPANLSDEQENRWVAIIIYERP
jgi:hypothetical protein